MTSLPSLRVVSHREVPPEVYSLLDDVPQSEKWWEAVELQKVLLARNSLTHISEEIGRLPCLTWLDVSYNALPRLPAAVGKLVELKSLLASHNKLECLPEEIGGAANLVKLDVSHNVLEGLPAALAACTLLAHLEACSNRIASLPASLGSCTALSHLNLENNQLQSIPSPLLSSLRNLRHLDLGRNKLQSLPDDIGALSSLLHLNAFQNCLVSVPSTISGCISLLELHLGRNKLKQLPVEIGHLPSLVTLSVPSNKVCSHMRVLEDLPPSLRRLSIQAIDVSDNDLPTLPAWLGSMTSLQRVAAAGNPIRTIRSTLINGPAKNLLDYLRSRLPAASADDHDSDSASASAPAALRELTLESPPAAASAAAAPAAAAAAAAPAASVTAAEAGMVPQTLQSRQSEEIMSGSGDTVDRAGEVERGVDRAGEVERGVEGEGDAVAAAEAAMAEPWLRECFEGGALQLSKKGLSELPRGIAALAAGDIPLTSIIASHNSLTSLPFFLSACTSLTELDLSTNKIAAWPSLALRSLPSLRTLSLANNPVGQVRLGQVGLGQVRLGRLPLTAPQDISTLQCLNLSGCCSPSSAPLLPPSFSLAALPRLTELHLSRLKGHLLHAPLLVPSFSLAALPRLTELHLHLRGNRLTAFPAGFDSLPSLRVLNLSQNQIESIPVEVTRLTRLESLDVSDNNIPMLPPKLGLMKTLSLLRVDGNPIRTIRWSIINGGTKALLAYLEDRIPA
ncbi:unnamed protein product [Closterium sp. NIES-65]|nr:unnamed protein product [Closterium sp. NIES-65]